MASIAEPLDREDTAEPTTAVEVPFWDKYNAHFEFPSSVVLSVLAFVTLFAVIIGVLLLALAGAPDRAPVPIRMVQGPDSDGEGRAGSGGQVEPLFKADTTQQAADSPALPNRTDLPDLQSPMPTAPADPTKPGQLAESSSNPFGKLIDALRNGAAGARQGSGPGAGSGNDPSAGDGPGGVGNDNTHKRSLRWSLRFTARGAEYLSQLATMSAVIVIPQPPEERDAFVYRDLRNPTHGVRLAESEWTKLAGQIQFVDTKPDSVRGLAEAIGVGFTPRRFLAFFPETLEQELARKETSYRGRRAEDIEETVFRVTVRGGQYEIVVEEQKSKR